MVTINYFEFKIETRVTKINDKRASFFPGPRPKGGATNKKKRLQKMRRRRPRRKRKIVCSDSEDECEDEEPARVESINRKTEAEQENKGDVESNNTQIGSATEIDMYVSCVMHTCVTLVYLLSHTKQLQTYRTLC